ncbi:MAG TPA: hypothetical protein K8V90_02770 [Romboutsia timonensis]|uniref:Membrane protein YczE n=1 Tax=Romboutsia timonensis TaxID=1776391 RepID=A0A921MZS0_9FIRM|nr:hypothetical protein [uncultured Romboutsia sp.]HJG96007.1 hypothetical protein [Romboutsia timonensis]
MESTLKFDKTDLKLRIVFFLVGLFIMGLGISLIAVSNFGNGPWDAVNIGLSEKTGLSIGLCMNIVAFIQIIIGGIIRKEFPNIVTMITSIFLGLFIDFWMLFLGNIVITEILMKFTLFILALPIISIGISIYLVSKLPNTPLDYFMLSIKSKFNLSLMASKITSESIGLVLGFILGGTIGIGTIIIILAIGPMIQYLQNPCNYVFCKLSQKTEVTTL